MVFIITGAAESSRNMVCRLLAEALGWEFVEAENLYFSGDVDPRKCSSSLANRDPSLRIESISRAINIWIYEWRDVVVSCPMLTQEDRRQLSKMSSLVKIVSLEEFHATDRTRVSDLSVDVAISASPVGSHGSRDPKEDLFTISLSRPVEEIIAELTAVLMTQKSPSLQFILL